MDHVQRDTVVHVQARMRVMQHNLAAALYTKPALGNG